MHFKILFFSHDANLYGASKSLIDAIEGLVEKNIQCHVILPSSGSLEIELNKLNVPYEIMYYNRWAYGFQEEFFKNPRAYLTNKRKFFRKSLRTFKSIFKNYRKIRQWNPDLIITNTSVIYVGAIYAWLLKKKHVWYIREYLDNGLNFQLPNFVFRLFLNNSNYAIFPSNNIRQHYRSSCNKSFTVYNGPISKREFDQFKDDNGGNKIFTFLMLGSISKNKNQEEALKAFSILKMQKLPFNIRLLIVGSGDFKGLESLALNLGILGDVDFMDFVSDPHIVYRQANAVLVCSKSESFGRVIIEAMAHSIPVIGYDNKRGTSELIDHGFNGLLYQGDHTDLSNKMIQLVNDDKLKVVLAENGWEYAKSNFSKETYVDNLYSFLKEKVGLS